MFKVGNLMDNIKYIEIKDNKGYYLPLFNLNGAYSSITPFFGGDFKTDYHHYALQPTSELGLFNLEFSRNVLFEVDGHIYKLNGQTSIQQQDSIHYHYGMLYQEVLRTNDILSLDTTSFLTLNDAIELHKVVVKNLTKKPFKLNITTAIPLYARSANNLFDHRHVTSLLNQIHVVQEGIIVCPTLSFDERGHLKNDTTYSVFTHIKNLKPTAYIPVMDDFIGGGSLSYPKLVKSYEVGDQINGYEAIGGIRYDDINLDANESITLYFSIGIHKDGQNVLETKNKYLNEIGFNQALAALKSTYKTMSSYIEFDMVSKARNEQLKWVTLQPILRRYFGNSYMPHHDYGHGGRGWRDLWQDLLSLIVSNDPSVKDTLFNNFKGVRLDGSNATIIGNMPGDFKADRNKIVRVWSDHGCWPLLTTKMYIDETGDLDFLFRKQTYFDDQFTHYTKRTKNNWSSDNFTTYQGTILEHLLLQNLIGYFNIGRHGYTRLEDADWNDGLDMANQLGETIAFTHFYANNLGVIAKLLSYSEDDTVELFEALYELLDQKLSLNQYFDRVSRFNEKTNTYKKGKIIELLNNLATEKKNTLRQKAWFDGYFQSYINNDGNYQDKVGQMSLTGQAMALLNEVALPEQAKTLAKHVKDTLFDANLGGYRLNSNYREVLTNMGRAYGFAYGHKENGAVFSHMAIMYAYGLYQYDLVHYGQEAYESILDRAFSQDSGVLAGIPEYFNDQGIGKYSYLTGSASWLIKLLRTEVFGISMHLGRLSLKPKLKLKEFFDGKATIHTYIFGQRTTITYINDKQLEFGKYRIKKIIVDGKVTEVRSFTQPFRKMEVYLDEHV